MINLGKLDGFNDVRLAKLQKACDAVNGALLDPVFLSILSAGKFDSTDETNDQVMVKVMKDATITELSCRYLGWWATHHSHTVAEESSDGSVTFNTAYFDNQDTPSLSNTLFHEFLHCCNEHHSSAHDYMSWPYQAGNMMEKYLRDKEG